MPAMLREQTLAATRAVVTAAAGAQPRHRAERDPELPAFRSRSIFGVYGGGGPDGDDDDDDDDDDGPAGGGAASLFPRDVEYGGGDTRDWPEEECGVLCRLEADGLELSMEDREASDAGGGDDDDDDVEGGGGDDEDVREGDAGEGSLYDDVYFDSEDEEEEEAEESEAVVEEGRGGLGASKTNGEPENGDPRAKAHEERRLDRRRKRTDADMLFDPNSDESDEAWITRKLQEHFLPSIAKRRGEVFLASGGRFSPETVRRLRTREAAGSRFDNLEEELKKMKIGGEADGEAAPSGTEVSRERDDGEVNEAPLPRPPVGAADSTAGRTPVAAKKGTEESRKQRHTDAVLTCPLCFTYLCYDCQQHSTYAGQFRAMFTENCRTVYTERYGATAVGGAFDESSKRPTHSSAAAKLGEIVDHFYPVLCEICNTQVAVQDESSVVHFFNVIAQAP